MASDSSSNPSSIGSVSSKKPPEGGPLWKYVEVIDKTAGGGNKKWICQFCKDEKQGSYSRLRGHLLCYTGTGSASCKEIPPEMLVELRRIDKEYDDKVGSSVKNKTKRVPLPSGPSRFQPLGSVSSQGADEDDESADFETKKRKTSSKLEKAFDMHARDQLDGEIARMFYTGGVPFTLARNPYFQSSYTLAANSSLGGYVPPSYNRLRTTLLERERRNVESLLDPIKGNWPTKGVSIVTDGWSDPQRRPLINFMVCSDGGPMFLKAVNCAGEVKDKAFIADLMKDVIDEIGHQNVVQIVTDNARNCKGAGELIEGIYPHIYWTPCVVHTLNLALKNICAANNLDNNRETYDECHWITEVHKDVVKIKNYIMNHSARLAMFNRFTPLKLLSVADTRFASMIIMLKRFKLIKRALEAMVVSEQWKSYRDEDTPVARFVREKLLDEEWWNKVDYILAFTMPIYDMIRACDTNRPCLHLVHEMWDSMIGKVKKAIDNYEGNTEFHVSPFYSCVHRILIDRWAKSDTPLHCLAHSLNPRYYSREWLDEDKSRVAPHADNDISVQRRKCFQRLFPNDEDYDKVMDEYGDFSLQEGPFGDPLSIKKRYSYDSRKWWANYGSATPLLQALARRVLGQPTSSSCSERNWSTYSFIHSLKRNKLNVKRAEDLVFIHNNLRLLSRNSEQYSDEKTKMWDVGGDGFGSLEDTSILEFADLSLDEPEMENVLVQDEVEEV